MSEGIGRNASKSFVARRTAAVIEEVSRGLFPTKIALFNTAGGGASHMCIKPFESKGKINFSYSSLNSLTPGGCNEDSVHIRVAAMELAKRKEKRKILFVLSDGLPSAYANRGSAEAEVRKAVDDATRMGIVVIPIMFGDMDEMQRNMRSYNAMYPKNLIVCEPKEISKKLPLVFRQLVLNR
jgi:nitric oxide reductase activation protein